jgi:hypothetical protein
MSDDSHEAGFPEVHDEAGDTPRWVPLLGLALLLMLFLKVGICATIGDEPTADVVPEPPTAAEAAEPAQEDG